MIFTSGGTEADNLAIVGSCLAARTRGADAGRGRRHRAQGGARRGPRGGHAGRRGAHLPVGRDGLLDLAALDRVLAEGPAVVSVMWVNNETGVVQPIDEIADRCAAAGVVFHTDAVQAFGRIADAGRKHRRCHCRPSPATRSAPPRASAR